MRHIPAVLTLILVLALLVTVVTQGTNMLPSPDVMGIDSAAPDRSSTELLSLQLQALDQLTGMLTTITVGLAVLVGFALRPTDQKQIQPSWFDFVVVAAFIVSIFSSVFYAYGARLKAFEFVVFRHPDFLILRDAASAQALALAAAAATAFYLVARAITGQLHVVTERQETITENVQHSPVVSQALAPKPAKSPKNTNPVSKGTPK